MNIKSPNRIDRGFDYTLVIVDYPPMTSPLDGVSQGFVPVAFH
jgi:hypothetical protein